jgi:arylsulfatase A-like enzyme
MQLSRRDFFLGSLAFPALAQKRGAPERPNVVLILADDLGSWMLGCYGNKEIRTPNIDRLSRLGTRFLNNYACTPASAASRATLLTGRTPMQHGVMDAPDGAATVPGSFAKEVLLSDVLAGAGYECGYAGRWDIGSDAQAQHGFKFWHTADAASIDAVTARAAEFLDQQNDSRPYFLTASYPLTPSDAIPQKYADMYAKSAFATFTYQPAAPNAFRNKEMLKDTLGSIRKCAAAVTALDDQVGALVAKLTQKGGADKTLVVFCADNGYLMGGHGLWGDGYASNPPNMYEEVLRVPMMWSWLGHVPADNTRPELVSLYDFVPSVCEAAGVPAPARNLCGRSYWSAVRNQPWPKKAPWRNLVFGRIASADMARDARYKLILRDGGNGPGELYDLRVDPNERTNQYDNPQFVVTRDRLKGEIAGWRQKYSA